MTFEPEFTPEPAPRLSWWERTRQRLAAGSSGPTNPARGRLVRRALWVVLALLLLYYPLGMLWIH